MMAGRIIRRLAQLGVARIAAVIARLVDAHHLLEAVMPDPLLLVRPSAARPRPVHRLPMGAADATRISREARALNARRVGGILCPGELGSPGTPALMG